MGVLSTPVELFLVRGPRYRPVVRIMPIVAIRWLPGKIRSARPAVSICFLRIGPRKHRNTVLRLSA